MYRLLLLALCFYGFITGLQSQALYWVQFTDKAGTPYSIDQPEEFLSPRALERRQRHGAAVTEADLPLSPRYLRAVDSLGAKVWLQSRWLNGATVVADEPTLERLRAQLFVDTVFYTAPAERRKPASSRNTQSLRPVQARRDSVRGVYYGLSYSNLTKLGGDTLHSLGLRGNGMLIAVLDAGFPLVDEPGFFGHADSTRIPPAYDLVEQDGYGYDGGSHGASVLSVIAAQHPFILVGTAPEASFVCIKTENTRGEYRQEEFNWVAGLELADSLGADLVNSSLGYTTFTLASMNYTSADLTGEVSPASRAANLAFARGMLVVSSAGNEGSGPWRYISIPADAAGVLAVGAVDEQGRRASFSSFGLDTGSRIKPDVVAPGVRVPAMATNGQGLTLSNGTSLAAPLITGLAACLWQAFPERTNAEIMDAIRQSASRAGSPNTEYGFGLPDFGRAYRLLEDGMTGGRED